MNPRYFLPQYPSPYPYRFPGHGMVNYMGWPNYSDVGLQMVYMQQYPQAPLVHQFEPLMYAHTLPPMWRPGLPTLPPHIYQTMGHQPVATQFRNQLGHQFARTSRSHVNRGRKQESTISTMTNAAPSDTQPKNTLGESRINPSVKVAVNEVSVFHQLRRNTTLYRQKRKVRRRRKKHPDKDKYTGTTGSAELSSIDMEGTRAGLNGELCTIDNVADHEYETCEEEDITPVVTGLESNTCRQQAVSKEAENAAQTRQEGRLSRDSAEFTSICDDKSYSHIAFNRDLVSVKSATVSRGKTFVVRQTKEMSLSHDVFGDLGANRGNLSVDETNVNPANEDYWAAISNVESLWDASRVEAERKRTPCESKKNICRCKNCIAKSNKKTRAKSSVTSTPTKGSITSPDLWWDRSEYHWAPANANDGNNNAELAAREVDVVDRSDEYVVVDFNRDANDNIAEAVSSNASNIFGQNPSKTVETSDANSSAIPTRRLLPVDWDSISRSRQDLEASSALSQDVTREKSRSITELDQAIVERGPLTTEFCSLPSLLQASLNDTLRRLKSSSNERNSEILDGLLGKTPKSKDCNRPVVTDFLRTAFMSSDASKETTRRESGVETQNPGEEVRDNSVSATCFSGIDAENRNDKAESCPAYRQKRPSTPSYKCVNAPRLSLIPKDLTPHLGESLTIRRSNSSPRKSTSLDNANSEVLSTSQSVMSLKMDDPVSGRKGPANFALSPTGAKESENVIHNSENKTGKKGEYRHNDTDSCGASRTEAEKVGKSIPPVDEKSERKGEIKFLDGFNFPLECDIFRKRACGISIVSGNTPVGARDHRTSILGQDATANKQIYEKSKPAKDTTDAKRSRTAPSTPSKPVNNLQKTYVSMGDLHDALLQATAANGTFQGKMKKSKSSAPLEKQLENVRASSQTAKHSTGRIRTGKNRSTKLKDTRLPTGLAFNGMLNDTIRRNFRERASPVAIFALSHHQTIDKESVIVSSPSIDDWSTILVQPVPNSANRSGTQISYLSKEAPTAPKRSTNGNNTGHHVGDSKPPRYLRLPVVMYSPDNEESRVIVHKRIKQGSHMARRRNSLSSLHYSVLSKGVRQRYRRELPAVQQRALKGGYRTAINETYPAYTITRSTCSNFSEIEKIDRSGQNKVAVADEICSSKAKSELEDASVAPCIVGTFATTTSDGAPANSKASESRDTVNTITEATPEAPDVNGDEPRASTEMDVKMAGESKGRRKQKESFLRRFIKPKKRSKNNEASSKTENGGLVVLDGEGSKKLEESTSSKPTRQKKVRGNFFERKNKFLQRDTKVGTKLPIDLTRIETGDVDANLQTPSDTLEPKNADARRPQASLGTEGRVDYVHRLKEEKTVKSAMYKPTFLCMAAIETPSCAVEERQQRDCSNDCSEGAKAIRSSTGLGDERDSLPTAIKQSEDGKSKSVVGKPGVRINSETGDVLEPYESKSLGTFMSSTQILENDSIMP